MDINWFLPLQAESEGQVNAQCCDSSALEPAEQTNTEHRTDIEADASASIDIEVVKETNLTEKIMVSFTQNRGHRIYSFGVVFYI